MKMHVSSGKRLSRAKAMAVSSSCRFYEAGTFHLDKMIQDAVEHCKFHHLSSAFESRYMKFCKHICNAGCATKIVKFKSYCSALCHFYFSYVYHIGYRATKLLRHILSVICDQICKWDLIHASNFSILRLHNSACV